MLLGCLPPNSARLRRFFFCLAYVIIGYVLRCAAERLLGHSAAHACAAAAAAGGGGGGAARWAHGGGGWGAALH
jgi:hypothetical protein